MNLYAEALRDPKQAASLTALEQTYEPAAVLSVKQCGAGYATELPNDAPKTSPRWLLLWTIAVITSLAGGLFVDVP